MHWVQSWCFQAFSRLDGDSVCVAYVYVFDAGSDDWVVRGAPLTGLPAADVFDVGVAISSNADVVAVGSSGSSSGLGEGSISVYTWVPGNSQYEELRDPLVGVLGEGFGGYRSLALSGSGLILAAAVTGRGANGPLSGGVRVFRSYRQGWVPMGSIIEGAAAGDLAGSSVGLSENGQVLLVASRGSDSNTGSLAVYVWTSGDWEQRGDVCIRGHCLEGGSGRSWLLAEMGLWLPLVPNSEGGCACSTLWRQLGTWTMPCAGRRTVTILLRTWEVWACAVGRAAWMSVWYAQEESTRLGRRAHVGCVREESTDTRRLTLANRVLLAVRNARLCSDRERGRWIAMPLVVGW